MNDNNMIYKFLDDYFFKKSNDIELDECYQYQNKLTDLKVISNNDDAELSNEKNKLIDLVIKTIANCPYIFIEINHYNKSK